jgi:hypothetical protein
MRSNQQGAWRKEPSVEDVEKQQEFQRVIGTSVHRQQAKRAGKMRHAYQQSSAQYLMRFQDFQKPSKRNRILRELGLETIHLPCDPASQKRTRKRRVAG